MGEEEMARAAPGKKQGLQGRGQELGKDVIEAIAKLAALLRRCGQRVLTDQSVLSLTWPLYQQVTSAVSLIETKQLEPSLLLNLEYLQSFLSRVPSIRLHHTSISEWNSGARPASLSPLLNVTKLELRRLPFQLVGDLASLQASLLSLSVDHCSVTLELLLASSLSSVPSPTPWPALTSLTLTHCSLDKLGSPLALLPALTHLDCSHNRLTTTMGLDHLPHLSTLLLSFNQLHRPPVMHPEAPLTTLALSYNRLEQLEGMQKLPCIRQLHLSGNCLMHHDALAPISSLPGLNLLDLRFNPVSCHPQHRTLAASWLHPSLSSSPVPPVLDGLPLTRQEVAMVGSSRLLAPPTMPSPPPFSSMVEEEHRSVSREGSIVTSIGGSIRRRKKKVREAVIMDQPIIDSEETTIKVEVEVTGASGSSSCYKDELLEALKKSQSVETYGGETRLEELLGITDKTPQKLPEREQVPEEISDRLKIEFAEPVNNPESKTDEDLIEKAEPDGEPERVAVCDLSTGIYGGRGERETSPQVENSDVCVLVKQNSEELQLTLGKEYLREQSRTGITKVKWFLHSLEKVEVLEKNDEEEVTNVEQRDLMISLHFNTRRRDRREREYSISEENYKILMSVVKPILAASSETLPLLTSRHCVRCSAVFNQALSSCPACGSTMLLEHEAEQLETGEDVAEACEALDFEDSVSGASGSSTGILASANQGLATVTRGSGLVEDMISSTPKGSPSKSSVSTTVTADIHDHVVKPMQSDLPDLLPRPEPPRGRHYSEEQEAGEEHCPHEVKETRKETSEERDLLGRDSKEKTLSPGPQRSESSSDISVLSNPSESSIEVLEPSSERQHPSLVQQENLCSRLQESLNSSKLTSSEDSQTTGCSENTTIYSEGSSSMVQSEGAGIYSEGTLDSEGTAFQQDWEVRSAQREDGRSIERLGSKGEDVSSIEGEADNTFHSCRSDSEDDGEMTAVGDSSLLRDTTLSEEKEEEEEEEFEDEREVESVMNWDFNDFAITDHRLQLYCDLSLFREGEVLLLVVRAEIRVLSSPSLFWPGLCVVTNKRIHLLRIISPETEEPSEWLEVRCSAAVTRLERLVGLVGGQGIGLELGPEPKEVVQHSFYRLPIAASQSQTSGDGGDCYYLLMRDRERTARMVQQLVDTLQQAVRATPIPVTWMTREEDSLLTGQVMKACPEAEGGLSLFQLARLRIQGEWQSISVVITPSHLVLTRDFFTWLFQPGKEQLEVLVAIAIPTIQGLSIFEKWPDRLSLRTASGHHRLKLETEDGVLQLVAALRSPWEAARNAALEEATKFHLSGSSKVVVMQTLLTDDSVTPSTFSLGQWIKVTSQAVEQKF